MFDKQLIDYLSNTHFQYADTLSGSNFIKSADNLILSLHDEQLTKFVDSTRRLISSSGFELNIIKTNHHHLHCNFVNFHSPNSLSQYLSYSWFLHANSFFHSRFSLLSASHEFNHYDASSYIYYAILNDFHLYSNFNLDFFNQSVFMLYGRYLLLLHNEGNIESLIKHLLDFSSMLDCSKDRFFLPKSASYNIELLIYQLIKANPIESTILLTRAINAMISIFLSSRNKFVRGAITNIILSYIHIAKEYNIYNFPAWLLEQENRSHDLLSLTDLNILDLLKTYDLALWLVPLYTKIGNTPSDAAICDILFNKKLIPDFINIPRYCLIA